MSSRSYGLQEPPSLGVKGKKRYAMVIDLRRCNGCGACMMACKVEFDLPLGVWRIWLKEENRGEFPNVRKVVVPALCNHCDYPICVRNCPTEATYKHADGFVLQRFNRCIGCRACMMACPYNARHLLPGERTDPQKPWGVADKCSFCVHRVSRGLAPACVASCTARAMIFGDLNDPESEVSLLLKKENVSVLRPDMGTAPQVYYIGLDEGGVSDPVSCDKDRSVALKDDYHAFKKNHHGLQFGDILEGEKDTSPLGFTRQVVGHLKDFTVDIFEKLGIIGRH
ncbi:MAG: 4Fe-4S dicluster domain-containing protein [Nitrosomonadales bacterium]|nr:4Fe-4S dicluster domain-containing protein [Nitrosomonadales bacterium]